jgi:hypothetical protein
MRFPKHRVEGSFGSIREAYEYRLQQLPERDPDERMKLALWCLNLRLTAEAKEQLAAILQLNPKHGQARAMLISIEQSATRAALRQRDPEVQQTRAEPMAQERPGVLNSAVIQRAQRDLGISGLPVIFDLPKSLAVKRADEFARYVHPLLQAYCARCHNGRHEGSFQLVPMTSRADRTPDAMRANLDAALQLIDPENPAKSELLSSALRPHGHGPNKRPIFPGSNDRAYQVLAKWVSNLRPPKFDREATRAEPGRTGPDQGDLFAADRNRIGPERADHDTPATAMNAQRLPSTPGMPAATKIPPPARFTPSRGLVPGDQSQADPQEFPLPFVVSGVKPTLSPPKAASQSSAKPPSQAPGEDHSSLPKLPEKAGATSEAATAKKPGKPLKLDPNILERALQNRNTGR